MAAGRTVERYRVDGPHGHIELDDSAASRTVARMAAWLLAPAPERFVAARLGASEGAS
jgi:hypothetical protein